MGSTQSEVLFARLISHLADMSRLKTNEKQILERLFQMEGGYVLNFSDRTIAEFFSDNLEIDFYAADYEYGSGSKANRMRGFWAGADDALVARSIRELLDYIEAQLLLDKLKKDQFPQPLFDRARKIADTLDGQAPSSTPSTENGLAEAEFIKKQFKDLVISELGLDGPTENVIRERLLEIEKCLAAGAPLSVIFLCGSTLEGILLSSANNLPQQFNQANSAPRKDGKVIPLFQWTLNNLIDCGKEVGLLGEDVKKFSHTLRDFRNFIHPLQQLSTGFSPHDHTGPVAV